MPHRPDEVGPLMTPDDSRRISLLLGLLFGLAGLGSASAAIAVSLVADDLGVSVGVGTWMISVYVLMLGVATAVYGRVSDLIGPRIPFLVGIVLMTVGAVGAAFAPSFATLLVARALQGAGVAAIPVLGVTIISARYDGDTRGLALGRLAAMAAFVTCLGPLAGGLFEVVAGWRGVMALPVLGLVVVPFLWRALVGEGSRARLDVLGAVLVAVSAAGLILLIQSPSSGLVVALGGVGLLALGAPGVAARVRRRPHGFLPRSVIGNPTVVRSALAAAAVPAAWFGQLVAVPAVLLGEGWAPFQVGLLLVPSAAIALFVPRLTSGLLSGFGPTASLAVAGATATLALLLAGLGAVLVSPVLLVVAVSLVTVSFGIGQPALSAAVGQAVDLDVRGVALGLATLVFLTGGSVGSAVVGGLGDVVGIGGSLALLSLLPVLGLVALLPELRRVPEPV
jgi:MFS family permease